MARVPEHGSSLASRRQLTSENGSSERPLLFLRRIIRDANSWKRLRISRTLDGINVCPPTAANSPSGLTADEARRRLVEYGRNTVAEEKPHLIRALLGKFWSPVPWMLEATIALELVLRKFLEGAIIAALLVFNASLSLV